MFVLMLYVCYLYEKQVNKKERKKLNEKCTIDSHFSLIALLNIENIVD